MLEKQHYSYLVLLSFFVPFPFLSVVPQHGEQLCVSSLFFTTPRTTKSTIFTCTGNPGLFVPIKKRLFLIRTFLLLPTTKFTIIPGELTSKGAQGATNSLCLYYALSPICLARWMDFTTHGCMLGARNSLSFQPAASFNTPLSHFY